MQLIYNLINLIFFKLNKVKHLNFLIRGIALVKNRGDLIIGNNFKANSGSRFTPIGGDTVMRLVVKKGARLTIGSNVGISNSTIYCQNSIFIGNNVLIGGSVKIWDTDFHSLDYKIRCSDNEKPTDAKISPIYISDNVFIGGSTIILKGTSIGENSVIGAGSVVHGIVPANQVWAGNPAKMIKVLPQFID